MIAKTLLFAVSLLVPAAAATAADPSAAGKAEPTQQTRMARCSADAKSKGLKGDARKEFMRGCLKTTPAERTARRECGASAKEKGLKGAARKSFVEECFKGKLAKNMS